MYNTRVYREIVGPVSKPWGKKHTKHKCNMCSRMEISDRLKHMAHMDDLLLEGDKGQGTCPICRVSILYMDLMRSN